MYLPFITIASIFVIAIVETILSLKWNDWYYSFGIQVFKKTIPFSNSEKISIGLNNFISHIDDVPGFRNYTGITLSKNTFYFRKKIFTIIRNDFDNVHGSIIVDEENRAVKIKGFISYNILLFFIAISLIFILDSDFSLFLHIFLIIFIAAFIAIIFAFSHYRYKKLLNIITQLIDEKDVNHINTNIEENGE